MPKYYAGDNRDTDIDIPANWGDPDQRIEEFLQTNCYAYALNLPDAGSLNPGYSTGSAFHGNLHFRKDFRDACVADGMEFMSDSAPVGELYTNGEFYTAALFGVNAGDMHWARVDSAGNWSDKMPKARPTYSSFQNDGLRPHEIRATGDNKWTSALSFVAYFRVYPVNVLKKYTAYTKAQHTATCCAIL